jgi:hypothetical protein
MDPNKQTLKEWLEYTKSLNLTLEELDRHIAFNTTCSFHNYQKLKGKSSKDKAKILFELWQVENINVDTSYLIPMLIKYDIK